MELAVIGISHRTAGLALRERIAFRVEQACEATDQLRARGVLKEAVILSTCNRTEVYGVARERSGDILRAMEMFVNVGWFPFLVRRRYFACTVLFS